MPVGHYYLRLLAAISRRSNNEYISQLTCSPVWVAGWRHLHAMKGNLKQWGCFCAPCLTASWWERQFYLSASHSRHTRAHTCACVHTHAHMCIHTRTRTCKHMHTHMCAHTHNSLLGSRAYNQPKPRPFLCASLSPSFISYSITTEHVSRHHSDALKTCILLSPSKGNRTRMALGTGHEINHMCMLRT